MKMDTMIETEHNSNEMQQNVYCYLAIQTQTRYNNTYYFLKNSEIRTSA